MPRGFRLNQTELERLRRLQYSRNLSDGDLARQAGVSERTVKRLFSEGTTQSRTLFGDNPDDTRRGTIGIFRALGTTLEEIRPLPDIPDAEADRVINGERASGNVVVRPSTKTGEPRTASHVVIAAFWQDKSAKKLRIHPKLCYRDPEHPDKIIKEPSPKEEYVRRLEESDRSQIGVH
jgi:AraC-like DNA-binding protein